MTDSCKALKSDSGTYKLCQFVTKPAQLKQHPLTKLDSGVQHIDYNTTPPKQTVSTKTKGNGLLEWGEVLARAFQLLTKENAPGSTSHSSTSSLSYFVHKNATAIDTPLPWILSDLNPNTSSDARIARSLIQKITSIKMAVAKRGFQPGTYRYNRELTKQLIAFVVKPRSKGGLGVKPVFISPNNVMQERNVLEILRAKNPKSHCTELSYLLYAVFKAAGLKPTFLMVYKDAYNIVSMEHYCIGVRLKPGKPDITPVDLTMPSKSEWFDTPHNIVIPITHSTMYGLYYNNKASTLYKRSTLRGKIPNNVKRRIKAFLIKGAKFAQNHPLLLGNIKRYNRIFSARTPKNLTFQQRPTLP